MTVDVPSNEAGLGVGSGMGAPPPPSLARPALDVAIGQRAPGPPSLRTGDAGASASTTRSGSSAPSPFDPLGEYTVGQSLNLDEEVDEDARMRASSTGPSPSGQIRDKDLDEADVPIAASEAARRRHFKALQTAKACDVCKIRKVKCDGREPCAACRAHSSACVYSQTTRTRLLSLSTGAMPPGPPGHPAQGGPLGTSTSSASSASARTQGQGEPPSHVGIPPPMGFDSAWYGRPPAAYESQMPASTRPFAPTDPSLFDNRPMLSPNTARTFGMQYPTLDAYSSTAGQQASSSGPGPSGWAASAPANAGEYSGWRGSRERTLPPIADFYLHSAPSNPRRWGNEPATHHQLGPIQFAPWNTHHEDARRFGSQTESRDSGHAASQIQKRNIDPPGTGPRAPASDDRLPRPSTSSLEGSAAHIQEGQGEYAEAGSSASAEQPERSPKRARITGPRRNSHDSSSVTQRDKSNSFQGHRPNRSTSASPASSAGEDVPRINSADPHPMGMVAVTTRQPGRGPSGLRWWGSTSFFACQVRLSQVIHTAKRRRRYPRRVSDGGSTSHQAAPRTKSLWIWGTNHILLDNPGSSSTSSPRVDIMFLPSSFADRFLHSYCITVHPLYPFYDLDHVRTSINRRFSGGVSYYDDQNNFLDWSPDQKLDHARDLLILAMGARIEGGNGDAHVPKPAAETWAAVLSQRSQKIMTDVGFQGGSSSIVKLWILHSLFSSMLGDVEQEYIAIGHAVSVCAALGLHRESACRLIEHEDSCVRAAFFVVYTLENGLSLRLGRPSRMTGVANEMDASLPVDGDLRLVRLQALLDLCKIGQSVQAIYKDRGVSQDDIPKLLAFQQELSRQLDAWRQRLPPSLQDMDQVDNLEPISMDSDAGERAMLKFDLALHYHTAKIQLWFPSLSHMFDREASQEPSNVDDELRSGAESCMRSASTLINVFSGYYAKLPYLPFDGHFCFCFLYVVPVVYMSILQNAEDHATIRRHLDIARRADRVLEKVDHSASRVARNMIKDIMADFGGEATRPTNPWDSTTLTEMDQKQG